MNLNLEVRALPLFHVSGFGLFLFQFYCPHTLRLEVVVAFLYLLLLSLLLPLLSTFY